MYQTTNPLNRNRTTGYLKPTTKLTVLGVSTQTIASPARSSVAWDHISILQHTIPTEYYRQGSSLSPQRLSIASDLPVCYRTDFAKKQMGDFPAGDYWLQVRVTWDNSHTKSHSCTHAFTKPNPIGACCQRKFFWYKYWMTDRVYYV